ncbi:MAG: GIY-YIG nuclease family protein [Natronospirillum sp.]
MSEKTPDPSLPAPKPSPTAAPWYVYLLQCADGTLYTGITTDLQRRVHQHNGAKAGGARYTRVRRPVTLVWSDPCTSRSLAAKAEHRVRTLPRQAKLALAANAVDQ